jgi:hypothetical protein
MKQTIALISAGFIIIAIAAAMYWQTQSEKPAEIIQVAPPSIEQQMHEILNCAALLAVNETAVNGSLQEDSANYNLISYALGKAQELVLQMGIPKGESKTLYDEKTLAYFLSYSESPTAYLQQHASQLTVCEDQLLAFEPNAQIQNTLKKAQEMAKEKDK